MNLRLPSTCFTSRFTLRHLQILRSSRRETLRHHGNRWWVASSELLEELELSGTAVEVGSGLLRLSKLSDLIRVVPSMKQPSNGSICERVGTP